METKLENIKFDLDIDKLKTQISTEYQMGFNAISKKRLMWRDQDKLFDGIADTDKIDLKTIFYNVQTWMATNYTDKKSAKFLARKFGGNFQAARTEKIAQFDQGEMNYSTLNYERELNRVLRGVGILALQGWDNNRKVPVWRSMDTRNWIPDPNGWLDPRGFRFHGFDISATFAQLSQESSFFNLDKLADNILNAIQTEGSETQTTRSRMALNANLNPVTLVLKENPLLQLYYHYTTYYDDKKQPHKLQTCWAQDRSILIKVQEILPVYEEEKENPELIMFPISLKYFIPKKGDPAGVSMVDLLQDKHRYKNVLANLMFIREKDAALGDDVIFDQNIVKNPNDLTRPTINKKFIGADGRMGPITQAIATVPRNPSPPTSYNFINFLDTASTFATGFDARQMGVEGSSDITLGEAQQIQANSNLKSQYLNEIGFIGEKHFWKLWLRSYRENFGDGEKKIVRVSDAFGTKNIEFTKEDFMTEEDPDIDIVSEADYNAKLSKDRTLLAPVLMQMMADPNMSSFNRRNIQEKLLKINGVKDDEMDLYLKEIPEILDAMNLLELINQGIEEAATIDPKTADQVDHSIYISIFKQALDNPVKFKAIAARQQMIIALGQNQQLQNGNQSALTNMATGSMLNQSSQQNPASTQRINPNQ